MANSTGGMGGIPNGNAGQDGTVGTNDYSSTLGGKGGDTPFGQGGQTPPIENATGNPGQGNGSGGSGASAWDRHGAESWAGGPGAPGIVTISW